MNETSVHPEHFRDVVGHFASGVTVITAVADGTAVGTTASAMTSLSLEPPMVVVCLNQDSQTGAAVAAAGRFAINVLARDQAEIARRLATKHPDKLAGVELTSGEDGLPLLAGAVAHIGCSVVETVRGGTHTVFIAAVSSASATGGDPLAYFRGRFARLEHEPES